MSLAESDKSTYVSSLLSGSKKEQIRQVMLHNMDVFGWTRSDMADINPVHTSHKLNVIPLARPVRQKMRRFHSDRYQVIQTEVDNLFEAGFIREIKYPECLANVVVVPKKRRKIESVCLDYTNLNEACPKDNFPLPWIDRSLMRQLGIGCCRFWTPSWDMIKYPCIRRTRRKQPLSPRTTCSATM